MKEALTPEMIVFAAVMSVCVIAIIILCVANYKVLVAIKKSTVNTIKSIHEMNKIVNTAKEYMPKEEATIKKMISMFDNDLIITS